MARGAAQAVLGWLHHHEVREAGWGEVENRLRKAAGEARLESGWTPEAENEVKRVAEAVSAAPEQVLAVAPSLRVKEVLPKGMHLAALGEETRAGWVLSFKAEPKDFRASRPADSNALLERPRAHKSGKAGDERRGAHFTEAQLADAEDCFSLAIAEGAWNVAALRVHAEKQDKDTPEAAALLIAREDEGRWSVWTGNEGMLPNERWPQVLQALQERGLEGVTLTVLPAEARGERIQALVKHFDGGRATVSSFLEERLREVGQRFVEPDATVDDGPRTPVLKALDGWLGSELPDRARARRVRLGQVHGARAVGHGPLAAGRTAPAPARRSGPEPRGQRSRGARAGGRRVRGHPPLPRMRCACSFAASSSCRALTASTRWPPAWMPRMLAGGLSRCLSVARRWRPGARLLAQPLLPDPGAAS